MPKMSVTVLRDDAKACSQRRRFSRRARGPLGRELPRGAAYVSRGGRRYGHDLFHSGRDSGAPCYGADVRRHWRALARATPFSVQ